MKAFKGIIRIDNDKPVLDAGGVIIQLDGDSKDFEPYNGFFTTVMGTQEGNVIRNASPAVQPETAAISSKGANEFEPVIAMIKAHHENLKSIPGVFGIRPGYSNHQDAVGKPVIIVVTNPGATLGEIPFEIGGIQIERRTATVTELTEGLLPLSAWEDGLAMMESEPNVHYKPPPADLVKLEEMQVSNITCHIGPDSGWKTLKSFLEGTTQSLTVAMYDFYADHIIEAITELGEQTDAKLNMILQAGGRDADIQQQLTQSWGDRLDFVKASVSGPKKIFNNSYHTKVAVRDSGSFWLSSGNWTPTSQPVIEPGAEQFLYRKGNREWHVIIEDEKLAIMYEKFIKYDMQEALKAGEPEAAPVFPDLLIPESFFEAEAAIVQPHPFEPKTFAATGTKVKVKPLMSPDNYAAEVLKLIKDATQSIYLQFSYINQPSLKIFDDIITTLSQKMNDGLDVRILVSSNQKQEHADLLIAKRGWKRSMFRRQTQKMHNKGILIDGKIAGVGSNNWSTDGTQYNRDTTLIFFSRHITKYFTEVFLFDWDNLARPIGTTPEIVPVIAPESGPTPLGMVRIPWQAWFDE